MLLTTIIVNYKSDSYIRQLIDQLVMMNIEFKTIYEIIIIDNNDEQLDFDIKAYKDFNITALKSGGNVGFSKANNLASLKATGKYLLFINPDVILGSFSISSMINTMEENGKIGILAPLVRDKKGEIQGSSFGRFPGIMQAASDFFFWNSLLINSGLLFKYNAKKIAELKKVDWVSGTCMLINRNIYRMINGFDKNIFMYYEDVDLCYRMNKNGYECVVFRNSEIIHLGGDYRGNDYNSVRRSVANRYYVMHKHNSCFYVKFVAILDLFFNAIKYLLWAISFKRHKMIYCEINLHGSLKAISQSEKGGL
jgi:N-acetylglucosaminyl-diphospho-decaprenol L-rhamnosyltransferase